MSGRQDPQLVRLQLWLLAGWTVLILSASLYPFDWNLARLSAELEQGLPRLLQWRAASQRDMLVNLLLYVPFGLVAAMTLADRRSRLQRVVVPVLAAAVLSLGVELTQHALPPRDPSLADWVFNVISAALGTLLALAYQALPVRPLSARLQRLQIGPALGLLIALWLVSHLAPFVPRLRPGRITAAIDYSLSIPLSPSRLLAYFACYVILGALVRTLMRRDSFWPWFVALLGLSLGARLLFVGQHLTLDECGGLLLALPVLLLGRSQGVKTGQTGLFIAAGCGFVAAALMPVTPAPTGLAPTWVPFAELTGEIVDPGALPLLERLFLGIGLAWLASTSRTGSFPPLLLALVVAVGCEFLQQWVPGRVPDASDFAALLIGAALVQAAPRLDMRTGRP